jgi:hypothetical protein
MRAAFVSTVVCPHCQADVVAHAELCSHCGQRLVCPNRPHEAPLGEEGRIIDRPWFIVVLLLHVGFLGIPFYWKTRYSLGTRALICLISIAYTLFVVAVVTWGLLQIRQAFAVPGG